VPRARGSGARSGARQLPLPLRVVEQDLAEAAEAVSPDAEPPGAALLEGEVLGTGALWDEPAGAESPEDGPELAEAGHPEARSPGGRLPGAMAPLPRSASQAERGRREDAAFRDYVTARSRSLLRTAYLLTGNRADAEDLVQAALAKTYLAWDRIEDRGAIDGYVRRAMVNTHISWWRRRRLEEFPTDEVPDQAVADHASNSDLQDSLRRAIDRLPQRMRAAVVLRYYEDMTEAEVAEVLGVSLGTVKSTVSRAVAKLRIDAELLAD
jgi:RNA polymerase sigma-70 factor (sigma-E family)